MKITLEQFTAYVSDAKEAHTHYEQAYPDRDHSDWPKFYAAYIMSRIGSETYRQDAQQLASIVNVQLDNTAYAKPKACSEARAALDITGQDLVASVGKWATGANALADMDYGEAELRILAAEGHTSDIGDPQ